MFIRNLIRIFSTTITVAYLAGCAVSNEKMMIDRTFRGIRPDDAGGRDGLLNPERGFRWENRIGSFKAKWDNKKWIGAIKKHADDGITVTQAYCELLDYCSSPKIPELKLRRLQEDFNAVRANGLKIQLCFRYEMNVKDHKGPTLKTILSHIKQLKPILLRNMDIIAVLQTGFIGLYGEWHRSFYKLDKNPSAQEKVLRALLDILPPDRKLLIRYPRHKNIFVKRVSGRDDLQPITAAEAHSMKPEARMGFCDHGFMVGLNDAGTFAPRPSRDYDYMTAESLFVPMEGEFFWAWSRPNGVKKDDGLVAIKRFWEHHYSLFSYAHNNTAYEGDSAKKKYNARFSLDEWRDDLVSPEFLTRNHIPFSPNYFINAHGKSVKRSIFEFVRDHLGYRLTLTKGVWPSVAEAGEAFAATLTLVNHGFAAPVNPRPVLLVVIDKGRPVVVAAADVDVRKLYPCDPKNREKLSPPYMLTFKTERFPKLPKGEHKLGLWMPDPYKTIHDDSRYAVRLANGDVDWWISGDHGYGVNIIGEISVK